MDQSLCDTGVTGSKISNLLSTSPELKLNGNHLESVDAQVIGTNQGFTSRIIRVSLSWASPSSDLPKSVIVKVIGNTAIGDMFQHMPKEHMDHMYEQLQWAHNIECAVYELDGLSKIVPMPRCFGKVRSEKGAPGIIILEDLSDVSYVKPITTWGMGISEGEVESILNALASVHAWSVNHTEWRKVIPSLAEFNVLAPLVEGMTMLYPASKEKFPDIFKDLDESTVKEKINSRTYQELFGCDPKSKYNLPLVMSHGDVHVMNMMFEKKPDGSTSERLVALIDWQISHQGCAAEDLARVLVICLSMEQRRKETERIVKRYVELFNSKVAHSDNHIRYEDMRRATDDMFAFFGVMWTCGIAGMDKFEQIITGDDPEQKKEIMDKMIEYSRANFSDAMAILKW